MPSTVSWAEVIWTTIGLSGSVNLGWLFRDLLRERARRIKAGVNGSDRLVEIERLGIKGILLTINLVMLAIGLFAMTQPPPDPNRPVTAVSLVLTLGILLIGALTNGLGLWLRWRRHVLRDYYDAKFLQAETATERLTRIDATTSETNEVVKRVEARSEAVAEQNLANEERLDRAEAREERRDDRAATAEEQSAAATQRRDDRRDERERNLH